MDCTDTPSQELGSTSVETVFIPANRALAYWPYAKEYLLKAYEQFPGEVAEDEIIAALATGNMQLVVAWDGENVIGAAVTKVAVYAEFQAVVVCALGGTRFEDWRESLDTVLEKFGRFHDCSRIEFHGRRGWERRLPNYKIHRIMMSRSI